ncbi:MAG: putative serine/threonine protein phosphatase [Acidimicrobiales bacterium]|jgi:serine/threonine protein phosphatase PrpC|nr:putative serine/threonine protein phosphatase [Acidimicrobiales bacterium]
MTTLRAGSATDIGRVRQINEDRILVDDGLFAVCDGLGGHQAGEVAAQTAVETIRIAFSERTADGLIEAIEVANAAVWQLAAADPNKRGMGTTVAALALVEQDGEDQLSVANVGDSRAYLFQRDELVRISEDHSLVEELVREGRLSAEEAQVHPQRSVITRALGLGPDVEVDSWQLLPFAGDRVLLCSDGLTNEVSEDRIASTLRRLADPQEAADDLVRQARESGGGDNISVVVVDVVDDDDAAATASAALAAEDGHGAGTARPTVVEIDDDDGTEGSPTPTKPKARQAKPKVKRMTWRVVLFLVLFGLVVGAGATAVGWYARHTYYVGIARGNIAIYQGRPGGLLWFDPTLDQRTTLPASDYPAFERELRTGHAEPSLADAQRYVNRIRQSTTTTTTPTAVPTTTTTAPTATTAPHP